MGMGAPVIHGCCAPSRRVVMGVDATWSPMLIACVPSTGEGYGSVGDVSDGWTRPRRSIRDASAIVDRLVNVDRWHAVWIGWRGRYGVVSGRRQPPS